MKCHITKARLEAAFASKTLTQLWDNQISGLYAECRTTGKGTYFLRYTLETGKKKTISLGQINILNPDDAREKARQILLKHAMGQDTQVIQSLRFSDVIDQYYLPWITSYKKDIKNDIYLLRRLILPILGEYSMPQITEQEILMLKHQLLSTHLANSTINRALILVRHVFNLSIEHWRLPKVVWNPAKHVPFCKVTPPKQVFLNPEQIAALLKVTKECTHNPHLPYIIALLSLTGARRTNVLEARWEEFNLKNKLWTIPITKSGQPHTIPLSDEVIRLLERLPQTSIYLFPNPASGKPYVNIHKSWTAVRRKLGLNHVRLHDLRHSFASLLINSGHSLYVVQQALGHHSPKVTQRYAHLNDDVLRRANDSVGSQMQAGLASLLN